MKGLVKYSLGSDGVELRELPEPTPKPGELKVKVLAASICGSDIHALHDERTVIMPVVLHSSLCGSLALRGARISLCWMTSHFSCFGSGIPGDTAQTVTI